MSVSDSGVRVETAPRLAQWRIDSLSSAFRKSDAFRIGLWNWFLTVERSKQICVKLCPEASSLTKEQPPIASFVIKLVYGSTNNRRTFVHPGISNKSFKSSDEFVWTIDAVFTGRFIIDVEFLDLKILPSSGGEPLSIWNGYHVEKQSSSAALASLSLMLSEGIHTDIIINVVDGSIGAHRGVLSSRSPVFRSMFSHNLKEKELSTINISDMSFQACRAFLNYIYGNFQPHEFLPHRLALLHAADKYDVSDLKDACHESLLEDIDSKNALERLQAAHLHSLTGLKSSCLRYLIRFGKVHEIRDQFETFLLCADRDLIIEIFKEVLASWNL